MACRSVLAVLLWLAVVHVPPQLPAVAGQDQSAPSPAPGPGGSPPPPAPGPGGSPLPPFASPGGFLPPSVVNPGGTPPRPIAGLGGSPPSPSKECQRKCGDVNIPFPFGIGPDHCSLFTNFHIDCNDTGNGVFKPILGDSNVEVISISILSGQMHVRNYVSSYCYNTSSGITEPSEWSWDMTDTPFTFSNAANKFTVVGCGTVAYIGDNRENDNAAKYKTGCVSMCPHEDPTALTNNTCSGMGCCQTAIPSGLQNYTVWFDDRLNQTSTSPCSYAVLTEESSFNFSTSYVTPSSDLYGERVPLVLDWVVGFDNCTIAPTKPGYACVSSNSSCINAAGKGGYICNCTQGFQGNPYVPDGCKDINECDYPAKYPCFFGYCTNTNGSFTCSCPAGFHGNATVNECQEDPLPLGASIAIGISPFVLVALVVFLAIRACVKARSNRRQGYFQLNGGKILLEYMNKGGRGLTFFDRGEILKGTSKFRKENIIGEGAHGTVFKGVISVRGTTTTVAVKRCKKIDQNRTNEFVKELVILSCVDHPNIVKIFGCCLHFKAPILVYEFVQNGTLNDLLHGKPRQRVKLSTRLRIIAETAEALAYLHLREHPTLHGDVKPDNILLGEGWVAKVSDFGCSTISDNVQVEAKGTFAYLDPEFMKDFKINDKTDVYSLGVVLMEILTGIKPLAKEQNHLKKIFLEAMSNGTLVELLDADVIMDEGALEVIHQTADLASRCTAFPGKTRPAMGQVAEELRRLSNEMPERHEVLQALQRPTPGYINAADESGTTGSYSVGTIAALSTELAR